MQVLFKFLEVGTLLISLCAVILTVISIFALKNHRDRQYKRKYEEFLIQKKRVDGRLNEARHH